MTKWVYGFGDGRAEGRADMRAELGGKGANLAEMSNIGLPVPPGFTIGTAVCNSFYANAKTYPDGLTEQVDAALAAVEKIVGATFGDETTPLLVSVRSGAPVSMPGMMDTILNLGLTDRAVEGLAQSSGDARFAYDSYRRFIQMYADVVLDVDHGVFEDLLETAKLDRGVELDTELTAEDLKALTASYKKAVLDETGEDFPQDPKAQLWGAIGAVLKSWMNPRANTYRRLNDISAEMGTAVTIQAMVFGNMGTDCATGVAFTRNPSTGENSFYGEYLINAQGEDVVAGIRTPQSITKAGRAAAGSDKPSMEEAMPGVFAELDSVRTMLEKHYKDMQDIEFTVQRGKLFMLQTRSGKRTAAAAVRIAVELANEGLVDRDVALTMVDARALDQLLHPTIDPSATKEVVAKGLPASPGAAVGEVCFTADAAEDLAKQGRKVILVRIETSPEDIHGMHAAEGVLTTRGGMTSHAAVVARGMGRACVSGAGTIAVDYAGGTFSVDGVTIKAGEMITIDGSSGEVMRGAMPMVRPDLSGDFATLMDWADGARRMKVRANAETPADVSTARKFGAEGVGLCRTEHMFFEADRIVAVRQMIMAQDEAGRRAALDKIAPMQRADFEKILEIMEGRPVTIRLLDPPLHEFLPHSDAELADVAAAAGIDLETARRRATQLHESNPMLGHRGCRLGVSFPEIYEMQARAIFEAAAALTKAQGRPTPVEVMIPLVATRRETEILKSLIDIVAETVYRDAGVDADYMVGTMIELPRAALAAGEIAEAAAFFSFGTNDLTQTALGLSRDDSAAFLDVYQAKGVYERDPFQTIDVEGVGQLVRMAAERGRATRPDVKLGICGEHGGDPASIAFCESIGLDYVSCSPFRVPIARLAAAQAAIGAR